MVLNFPYAHWWTEKVAACSLLVPAEKEVCLQAQMTGMPSFVGCVCEAVYGQTGNMENLLSDTLFLMK